MVLRLGFITQYSATEKCLFNSQKQRLFMFLILTTNDVCRLIFSKIKVSL